MLDRMSSKYQHELQQASSERIFDLIASRYDRLNRILSLGVDRWWRRYLTKDLPKQPAELVVLDLATGTGDLAFELGRSSRIKQVQGIDPSSKMLDQALKKKCSVKEASKFNFTVADGQSLPFEDEGFDLVTIAFGIRNYADFRRGLKEAFRVLKPDGELRILEFGLPANRIFRFFYLLYFRNLLPIVGGWLSGNKQAYLYLNQSVESFPYGQEFIHFLNHVGFRHCQVKALTFGVCYYYRACKS